MLIKDNLKMSEDTSTNFEKSGKLCCDELKNEPVGGNGVEKLLLKASSLGFASCCAPCSVAAIHELASLPIDLHVIFYNPNIDPEEEYIKRKNENKRVCEMLGVPFYDLDYEPEVWLKSVAGLEGEPERGARCSACFLMRLIKVGRFAKSLGCTHFTSSFGISRHKDEKQVAVAGFAAAEVAKIPYLALDFKSGNWQILRRELIAKNNIYQQKYCGCVFSKKRLAKLEVGGL